MLSFQTKRCCTGITKPKSGTSKPVDRAGVVCARVVWAGVLCAGVVCAGINPYKIFPNDLSKTTVLIEPWPARALDYIQWFH